MPISCPLRAFSPDAQTTLTYPFPPPLPPPLYPNVPSNRHFYSLPSTTPHTSISPSSSPSCSIAACPPSSSPTFRSHISTPPARTPYKSSPSASEKPPPLQNRSQLIELCPCTPNSSNRCISRPPLLLRSYHPSNKTYSPLLPHLPAPHLSSTPPFPPLPLPPEYP